MKAAIALISIVWVSRITSTVAPSPYAYDKKTFSTTEAIVLEEGETWKEGQSKRFHNNRCEARLQKDGNFVVKRIVAPNPYYQQYRTAWSTGAAIGDSSGYKYRAKLDANDGSLIVIRRSSTGDKTITYTSNIGEPEALEGYNLERTHKLVINEECVLKIYRGGKEAWTNNRYGGLGGEPGLSDYLQKGEMFHLNQCFSCDGQAGCIWYPQTLFLQQDCNLVQFNGRDWADWEGTAIWSSGTPRDDLTDCYLYSDEDKVRLYEGTLDKSLPQFAPRDGPSYWEADADFFIPCSGGYEVLLQIKGGLEPSC